MREEGRQSFVAQCGHRTPAMSVSRLSLAFRSECRINAFSKRDESLDLNQFSPPRYETNEPRRRKQILMLRAWRLDAPGEKF
jgi:hypothetical protein